MFSCVGPLCTTVLSGSEIQVHVVASGNSVDHSMTSLPQAYLANSQSLSRATRLGIQDIEGSDK